MKTKKLLAVTLLITFACFGLAAQDNLSAKQIMDMSFEAIKGTRLLTFDYKVKGDDMWLYRIISSEKAKSFMGSEFSYSDTGPPNLDDFNYGKLGEADVKGTLYWKIEMAPINNDIVDENGFSKKISIIAKEDFVLRKAIYYDLDGELLKELEVKEIGELDTKSHKYRLIHMIVELFCPLLCYYL